MAQVTNKTLPGISPLEKVRLSYSDTPLADAEQALSPAQLQHGLLSIAPILAADRTLTLPDASTLLLALTQLTGLDIGDAIPFTVRNQAPVGVAGSSNVIVALGVGGTADSEANLTVLPGAKSTYIIRIDDANSTVGVAAYTLFQDDAGLATAGAVPALISTQGAGAAEVIAVAGTYQPTLTDSLVINPDGGASSGIGLASGPPTVFTITQAGTYKLDVNVGGTVAGTLPVTIGVALSINGVLPTVALCTLSETTISPTELSSAQGSLIAQLAAGDTINLAVTGSTAADSITINQASVNIHKVA